MENQVALVNIYSQFVHFSFTLSFVIPEGSWGLVLSRFNALDWIYDPPPVLTTLHVYDKQGSKGVFAALHLVPLCIYIYVYIMYVLLYVYVRAFFYCCVKKGPILRVVAFNYFSVMSFLYLFFRYGLCWNTASSIMFPFFLFSSQNLFILSLLSPVLTLRFSVFSSLVSPLPSTNRAKHRNSRTNIKWILNTRTLQKIRQLKVSLKTPHLKVAFVVNKNSITNVNPIINRLMTVTLKCAH